MPSPWCWRTRPPATGQSLRLWPSPMSVEHRPANAPPPAVGRAITQLHHPPARLLRTPAPPTPPHSKLPPPPPIIVPYPGRPDGGGLGGPGCLCREREHLLLLQAAAGPEVSATSAHRPHPSCLPLPCHKGCSRTESRWARGSPRLPNCLMLPRIGGLGTGSSSCCFCCGGGGGACSPCPPSLAAAPHRTTAPGPGRAP